MSNNGKILRLDQQIIEAYDDVETRFYPLKESEAIMLLTQVLYISWRTRWVNLTWTDEQLQELSASVADGLMNPMNLSIFDCTDVENCLESSQIIQTLETTATNAQTTANNAQNSANQAQAGVDELNETTPVNEYQPAPTIENEPDELCGASWYITNQLHDYIQDVITDAQAITLAEFLASILPIGGWKSSLIKILWDFVIANTNPNLSQDVTDAKPYVAESFYCNQLSPVLAKAQILGDSNITADAKSAYIGAIDSWLSSKFNINVEIGRTDLTQDCSGFCVTDELWTYSFDMIVNDPFTTNMNIPYGQWLGDGSGLRPTVAPWNDDYIQVNQSFDNPQRIDRVEVTYKEELASITLCRITLYDASYNVLNSQDYDFPTGTRICYFTTQTDNVSHVRFELNAEFAYNPDRTFMHAIRIDGYGIDPQLF